MLEAAPEPPGRGLALSERFFREARAALLDQQAFDFSAEDVLTIARNAALRSDFERRFRTEINDPELGRLILRFLEEMAISLEESAAGANDGTDTLDKAGLPIAIPVTIGAAGAIVATAASIGSIIFLAAGLVGIASLGIARHITRRKAREDTYSAARLRGLIKHLETGIGPVAR